MICHFHAPFLSKYWKWCIQLGSRKYVCPPWCLSCPSPWMLSLFTVSLFIYFFIKYDFIFTACNFCKTMAFSKDCFILQAQLKEMPWIHFFSVLVKHAEVSYLIWKHKLWDFWLNFDPGYICTFESLKYNFYKLQLLRFQLFLMGFLTCFPKAACFLWGRRFDFWFIIAPYIFFHSSGLNR